MLLSDFDFELPPELIAQEPCSPRDASRLLVLRGGGPASTGHVFRDLPGLLPPETLLVLNETRVIPARLHARRPTGGKAEVLLVRPAPGEGWEALIRAGGRPRPPEEVLDLGPDAPGLRVLEELGPGRYRVAASDGADLPALAERLGHIPLPPYIRRPDRPSDRDTYQTVFGRVPGAIAAPTAGLHFTPELLQAVADRGVELTRVVLHVGLGTFSPIRSEQVEEHEMEAERYQVPPAAQRALAAARAAGRPVVACGTTAVRALEAYGHSGQPEGETRLFIRPGHEFRLVDGLITNFHLPKSTLLLLVAALVGREPMLAAYRQAVSERFRFYSYGDAMLLLP